MNISVVFVLPCFFLKENKTKQNQKQDKDERDGKTERMSKIILWTLVQHSYLLLVYHLGG